MEKKRELFLIISALLIISFVSASFNIGDLTHSIETEYPQDSLIKGWINMSFEGERANSIFSDSFGNSIRLIDLLELNEDSTHTCLPNDCTPDYIINGPEETTKTFSLDAGEEKVIGFKIIGDLFEDFTSFSMNVSSDVGETIFPSLYVDILNDEEIEWTSHVSSNNFYDKIYGCYDNSSEIDQDFLYQQRYCQKIQLPVTSKIELGANIIKEKGGDVDLEFEIRDSENERGFCDVTANDGGEISCSPDYKIQKPGEFLVCINTKSSTNGDEYKINSEVEEPCGFAVHEGNGKDFEIFVKPSQFSEIGEFVLDENELQSSGNVIDLKSYIDEYLERYNFVCSGDGCIIPISFTAGTNAAQEITLSNTNFWYKSSGTPKKTEKIYDLESTAAKISSEFQKLYFDKANFNISGTSNEEIDYSLSLDNNELFSEEIIIRDAPKIISLNTQRVVAGYPIEFVLRIRNNDTISQITEYNWDFGDSSNIINTKNKTTHTYNSIGNFTLKVSIKDSRGIESFKEFRIIVDTPRDSVKSLLEEKLDNLNKIKLDLEALPIFQKNSLNTYLKIVELETEISSLRERNENAAVEEDYVPIINDLINVNVPDSLLKPRVVNNFQFYSNDKGIDLEILKEISGEEYDINLEEEEYINAIILWNLENLDLEIDNEEFSISYSEGDSKLAMNFFILDIKGSSELEGSFLIIQKFQDIVFKENYNENKISGYYYFDLNSDGEKIEFSTTEELNLSTMEIFVSPKISNLEVIRLNISEGNRRISKTAIIILTIFLVVLIGLIAYMVLQEWYRNKYESYLFKNKNNLYNIVSYVHNEKKKGLKGLEISKKLKKAGWSAEQVRYVMRKYAGKRIGLIELPVGKTFKIFSGKEKQKSGKSPYSKKP
jgi:hypothetical protein